MYLYDFLSVLSKSESKFLILIMSSKKIVRSAFNVSFLYIYMFENNTEKKLNIKILFHKSFKK